MFSQESLLPELPLSPPGGLEIPPYPGVGFMLTTRQVNPTILQQDLGCRDRKYILKDECNVFQLSIVIVMCILYLFCLQAFYFLFCMIYDF